MKRVSYQFRQHLLYPLFKDSNNLNSAPVDPEPMVGPKFTPLKAEYGPQYELDKLRSNNPRL
jgi:hypothetical protein